MDTQQFIQAVDELYNKFQAMEQAVDSVDHVIHENFDKRKKSWAPYARDVLADDDFKAIPKLVKHLEGAIMRLRQVAFIECNRMDEGIKEWLAVVDDQGTNAPELDYQVWAIRVRTKNCTMDEAVTSWLHKLAEHAIPLSTITIEEKLRNMHDVAKEAGHCNETTSFDEFIELCNKAVEEEIIQAYNAVGSQWS